MKWLMIIFLFVSGAVKAQEDEKGWMASNINWGFVPSEDMEYMQY